jgi:hypothetical protein
LWQGCRWGSIAVTTARLGRAVSTGVPGARLSVTFTRRGTWANRWR